MHTCALPVPSLLNFLVYVKCFERTLATLLKMLYHLQKYGRLHIS
jgi:hypothetical protein